MSTKKISNDAANLYNNLLLQVADQVTSQYGSLLSYTKKVDHIINRCDLSNKDSLYCSVSHKPEYYASCESSRSEGALASYIQPKLNYVKKRLDATIEKASTNDHTLKSKLESRKNEVTQLKAMITEYTSTISGAGSLNAKGLVSGLNKIASAHHIAEIPGVLEGREKKLAQELNMANNKEWWRVDGKVMSEKQVKAILKKNYRHLSEKELAQVTAYYMYKINQSDFQMYGENNSDYKDLTLEAQLVIINGEYKLIYQKKTVDNKVEFFQFDAAAKITPFKPSLSANLNGDKSIDSKISTGIKGKAELKVAGVSGKAGGVEWSAANVETSAGANIKGAGISAGASAFKVGTELSIYENDLYRYGMNIEVSTLSAEVSAKLSTEGIKVGASTGLVGVSVSGGRTELIDLNTDL